MTIRFARTAALLWGAALALSACGSAEEGATTPAPDVAAGGTDTAVAGTDAAAGTDTAGTTDTGYNICESGIANCDKNATCKPISDTKYECTCNEGFTGSGKVCCGPGYNATPGGCSDIHECNEQLDDCDPNANCSNTTGSFTCKCKTGYEGDGKTCTPVGSDASSGDADAGSTPDTGADAYNICDTPIAKCDPNANCAPTSTTTYTCTCKEGFTGDGKKCCGPGFKQAGILCSDIHECNENLDDCDPNANCSNTSGGFG